MSTETGGDLLHWFQPGTHGTPAPLVEKLASPTGTGVFPKPLEVFAQQARPHGLQIVPHQLPQFHRLLVCEILGREKGTQLV